MKMIAPMNFIGVILITFIHFKKIMKVRFNSNLGVVYIVLGIIVLFLHLYVISLTGRTDTTTTIRLAVPLMLIVIGILYLTKVYFEVTKKELIIYSPIGFMQKQYSFNSYADFVVDGKKIFLQRDGKLKRIRLYKFSANAQDWHAFLNLISNDLTHELHNVK